MGEAGGLPKRSRRGRTGTVSEEGGGGGGKFGVARSIEIWEKEDESLPLTAGGAGKTDRGSKGLQGVEVDRERRRPLFVLDLNR